MAASPEDHFADYFEKYRTETGLVQDRSSSNVCSIAATGFGFDVWAIRATKGKLDKNEVVKRIYCGLNTVNKANPSKNRGWLFHFIDKWGKPTLASEVSTIDTAIFYSGALQAAKRLENLELQQKIEQSVKAIDVEWMIHNSPSGKRLCHGILQDGTFIPHEWDEYNEGIIAYNLFGIPFFPSAIRYNLPLFVYYYPLCFSKDQELKKHLERALKYQQERYGYRGITSVDTQLGYEFYPIGYMSPIALYAAGEKVLNPTIHSIQISTGWVSRDRIGIEEGAAFIINSR